MQLKNQNDCHQCFECETQQKKQVSMYLNSLCVGIYNDGLNASQAETLWNRLVAVGFCGCCCSQHYPLLAWERVIRFCFQLCLER